MTSDANRNMQGVSPPRADAVTTGKPSYRRGNLPSALRGLARMAKDVPAMLDGDPEAEEETYDFEDSFSTQPGVPFIYEVYIQSDITFLGKAHWNLRAFMGSWGDN